MSSSDEIEIVEERAKKSTNKKMTKSGKLKRTIASMIVVSDKEELANRKMVLRGADLFKDFGNELKCTKCCVKLTNDIKEGRDVLLHPALGVLFCKKCSKWYAGDDDWSVDEDEEDKYCRWCGEGGRIFLCSKCTCGFCPKCIKMHLGKVSVTDIESDDNWKCLICHPVPLWHLRHIAHLAVEVANENRKMLKDIREQKLKELMDKKEPGRKQPKRRVIVQEDSSDTDKAKGKASDTDDSTFKKRPGPKSKTVTSKENDNSDFRKPGPKSRTRGRSNSVSSTNSQSIRTNPSDSEDGRDGGKPKQRVGPKSRTRDVSESDEGSKDSVRTRRLARTQPAKKNAHEESDSEETAKRPGPKSRTRSQSGSESKGGKTRSRAQTRDDSVSSNEGKPSRQSSKYRERSASEESDVAKKSVRKSKGADDDDDWGPKRPGPKSKTSRKSDSGSSDRLPPRRKSTVDRSASEDSGRVKPKAKPGPKSKTRRSESEISDKEPARRSSRLDRSASEVSSRDRAKTKVKPGPKSKTRRSESEISDKQPARRVDRSASEAEDSSRDRAKPKPKPGPKSKTRRSESEISDKQPARRVDRSASEDSSRDRAKPKPKPGPKSKTLRKSDSESPERMASRGKSRADRSESDDGSRKKRKVRAKSSEDDAKTRKAKNNRGAISSEEEKRVSRRRSGLERSSRRKRGSSSESEERIPEKRASRRRRSSSGSVERTKVLKRAKRSPSVEGTPRKSRKPGSSEDRAKERKSSRRGSSAGSVGSGIDELSRSVQGNEMLDKSPRGVTPKTSPKGSQNKLTSSPALTLSPSIRKRLRSSERTLMGLKHVFSACLKSTERLLGKVAAVSSEEALTKVQADLDKVVDVFDSLGTAAKRQKDHARDVENSEISVEYVRKCTDVSILDEFVNLTKESEVFVLSETNPDVQIVDTTDSTKTSPKPGVTSSADTTLQNGSEAPKIIVEPMAFDDDDDKMDPQESEAITNVMQGIVDRLDDDEKMITDDAIPDIEAQTKQGDTSQESQKSKDGLLDNEASQESQESVDDLRDNEGQSEEVNTSQASPKSDDKETEPTDAISKVQMRIRERLEGSSDSDHNHGDSISSVQKRLMERLEGDEKSEGQEESINNVMKRIVESLDDDIRGKKANGDVAPEGDNAGEEAANLDGDGEEVAQVDRNAEDEERRELRSTRAHEVKQQVLATSSEESAITDGNTDSSVSVHPKRRKSIRQRTEEREARRKPDKSKSDIVDSLTNLKTLKRRRKKKYSESDLESDTTDKKEAELKKSEKSESDAEMENAAVDKNEESPEEPEKKTKSKVKTLMDMMDGIYSGSSDDEAGDENKDMPKEGDWFKDFCNNERETLKSMALDTSGSEMESSGEDETNEEKEKKKRTKTTKEKGAESEKEENSDSRERVKKRRRKSSSLDIFSDSAKEDSKKENRSSRVEETPDEDSESHGENRNRSDDEKSKKVDKNDIGSGSEKGTSDASASEKGSPKKVAGREEETSDNKKSSGSEKARKRKEKRRKTERLWSGGETESDDSDDKTYIKKALTASATKRQVLASSSSENDADIIREEKSNDLPKKRKVLALDSDSSADLIVMPEEKKTRTVADSDSEISQRRSDSEVVTSDGEGDLVKRKKQKESKEATPKKYKRIANASDSDASDVEVLSQNTPSKGRRNIKQLMKKDALKLETKQAVKAEEERMKKLEQRKKEFDKLFPDESNRLILDFDEKGEVLVEVSRRLVKKLKPHQKEGVRFMWNNCFYSLREMEDSNGGGCILAHCMGLGKTLQVITLLHTVLTGDMGVSTALVVCPLNTVANWGQEFDMWLKVAKCDTIDIYQLHKYKSLVERRFQLKTWIKHGGVMIISYNMFRTLVTKNKLGVVAEALVSPGPDIIICDEGHLLKNETTAISKCISLVQTSRRIVLTGTPLQNNLREYHCMVQFIKPNVLGTKMEFANRFVNPIENGQFGDSKPEDVRLMKRRSHVLYTMLSGCIQRQDYSVLTPFLPPKQEYVINIALSEPLAQLYRHYIGNFTAGGEEGGGRSLFADFQTLSRIWTHPISMLAQFHKKAEREKKVKDNEDEYESDFIDDGTEDEDDLGIIPKKKHKTRQNPSVDDEVVPDPTQEKPWWDGLISEQLQEDERVSNKLVIFFDILDESVKQGDKLLVFSQSLFTLDLIEHFLANRCQDGEIWRLGKNYYRLDGATNSDQRSTNCKMFNRMGNSAKLFLISTRAGGLGINLVGANRVVVFDVSWNPSHDLQSIYRVFRFGQTKPVYVYRLVMEATMEAKVYERQVTKLSLAHRVVDEYQIERHYQMGSQELYRFEPLPRDQWKTPNVPKDDVLAKILQRHKDAIVSYHEHDSLLENKHEEELTEEERKKAWEEYVNPPKPVQLPYPGPMGGYPGQQFPRSSFMPFPKVNPDGSQLSNNQLMNQMINSMMNSSRGIAASEDEAKATKQYMQEVSSLKQAFKSGKIDEKQLKKYTEKSKFNFDMAMRRYQAMMYANHVALMNPAAVDNGAGPSILRPPARYHANIANKKNELLAKGAISSPNGFIAGPSRVGDAPKETPKTPVEITLDGDETDPLEIPAPSLVPNPFATSTLNKMKSTIKKKQELLNMITEMSVTDLRDCGMQNGLFPIEGEKFSSFRARLTEFLFKKNQDLV